MELNPALNRPGNAAPVVPSLDVVCCPECGGLELRDFVGDDTGAIVKRGDEVFADKAGYLYCAHCGAVTRELFVLPHDHGFDTRELPPTLFATDILGTSANFNPRDTRTPENFRLFRRLAKTHARYATDRNSRSVRRASDRIYDAEALCALLDLPGDVKAAVNHHITFLTEHADMRGLSNAKHEDGKVRAVRSEAITIATVFLVMERFNIDRRASLDLAIEAFQFTKGPTVITPQEYRAAFHALAAWFGSKLWRDGTHDSKGEN